MTTDKDGLTAEQITAIRTATLHGTGLLNCTPDAFKALCDQALSAIELRQSLAAAQAERDDAADWIRVVGEELVLAGYDGGDRTVRLAALRSALAELARWREPCGDVETQVFAARAEPYSYGLEMPTKQVVPADFARTLAHQLREAQEELCGCKTRCCGFDPEIKNRLDIKCRIAADKPFAESAGQHDQRVPSGKGNRQPGESNAVPADHAQAVDAEIFSFASRFTDNRTMENAIREWIAKHGTWQRVDYDAAYRDGHQQGRSGINEAVRLLSNIDHASFCQSRHPLGVCNCHRQLIDLARQSLLGGKPEPDQR